MPPVYLPLIDCDSCQSKQRHRKVRLEQVPDQATEGETVTVEIWKCSKCGEERQFGLASGESGPIRWLSRLCGLLMATPSH